MRLIAKVAVVCMSALAPLAFAQEQECQADIKKVCKDATGKDVFSCIEKNQAAFSEPCKKKIAEVKGKWPELVKACQPDMEKTCGTGKVGDGTLGKCVKANESKMSSGCKTAYASMKAGNVIPAGVKVPKGIPGFGK